MLRTCLYLAALAGLSIASATAADWKPLFNAKNLEGWEAIGDGVWLVMADGTLLGERKPPRNQPMPGAESITRAQYNGWRDQQSWLYTVRNDFADFDLHLEFWTRVMGNSGVSLRDASRAKFAVTLPPDFTRTPSNEGDAERVRRLPAAFFPDINPSV